MRGDENKTDYGSSEDEGGNSDNEEMEEIDTGEVPGKASEIDKVENVNVTSVEELMLDNVNDIRDSSDIPLFHKLSPVPELPLQQVAGIEFEHVILSSKRRKSLGSLQDIPLITDEETVVVAAEEAIKAISDTNMADSEVDASDLEGYEDDWSSSDEVYAKMFPDKAVVRQSVMTISNAKKASFQEQRSNSKKKSGRKSKSKPSK